MMTTMTIQKTTTEEEEILKRRNWLTVNFDWLMEEVVYYRENKIFFQNPRIYVWKFDEGEGKAEIK